MDVRDLRFLARQYQAETTDIGRKETAQEFGDVLISIAEHRRDVWQLERPKTRGPWAWALADLNKAVADGRPYSLYAIATEAAMDSAGMTAPYRRP